MTHEFGVGVPRMALVHPGLDGSWMAVICKACSTVMTAAALLEPNGIEFLAS